MNTAALETRGAISSGRNCTCVQIFLIVLYFWCGKNVVWVVCLVRHWIEELQTVDLTQQMILRAPLSGIL